MLQVNLGITTLLCTLWKWTFILRSDKDDILSVIKLFMFFLMMNFKWILDDSKSNLNVKLEEMSMDN